MSAFTIVELLIVIVVIAILATVSIVAYNGIQTRAENSKTTNVVGAYVKALSLYAVDNGLYPSTTVYPCLGSYEGTTNCARLVTGSSGCGYSGTAPQNAAFDAVIAEYLGQKPIGSNQRIDCNGDQYVGAYLNATSSDPKNASIIYYLKGNQPCSDTIGTARHVQRMQSYDTTFCRVALPSL